MSLNTNKFRNYHDRTAAHFDKYYKSAFSKYCEGNDLMAMKYEGIQSLFGVKGLRRLRVDGDLRVLYDVQMFINRLTYQRHLLAFPEFVPPGIEQLFADMGMQLTINPAGVPNFQKIGFPNSVVLKIDADNSGSLSEAVPVRVSKDHESEDDAYELAFLILQQWPALFIEPGGRKLLYPHHGQFRIARRYLIEQNFYGLGTRYPKIWKAMFQLLVNRRNTILDNIEADKPHLPVPLVRYRRSPSEW